MLDRFTTLAEIFEEDAAGIRRLVPNASLPSQRIMRAEAAALERAAKSIRQQVEAVQQPNMLEVLRPLADELGFAEWATPEQAEEILRGIISKFYVPVLSAISKAEGN